MYFIERMLEHCKHYHDAGWTLKVLDPGEKVQSFTLHNKLDGRVRAKPGDMETVKWWIEQLGQPNIGLDLYESKICVVDIDNKDDTEGLTWLFDKQPSGYLPKLDYDTARSHTPHGEHVLFQNNLSPESAVPTPAVHNGVLKCPDCRHKIGDFLARGHIVLPPSVVNDMDYYWAGPIGELPDNLDALPFLPQWVFDLVISEAPGSYDGSDYDDDEDYYEDWGDDTDEFDPNKCPDCGGDLYVSGETVCCQNLECGWVLADDEEEEVEEEAEDA